MERGTRFKVLWTLWMTAGGVLAGIIVYATTNSVRWTIVAVLGAGVVLSAIGRAVVEPAHQEREGRDGDGDR